ncbi:hypothetical protein CRYUN_Cryun32bG0102200 [Craigia yunnanensis]
MLRFMCKAFVGIIIAVALIQCTAAQTVHVVGDDMGWTIPLNGATAYSTWAAMFNFTTNEHDVLQVPKASFDACSDANPIGNMVTNGPANVTINSAGERYYICTIGQHRQLGQKLAITVSGSSGSPLPVPSPTTTPTTPSPTSGTPVDCTPAPTSGPSPRAGSTPPGSMPGPNGAPNSSSSTVFASWLLSMMAIVMGLIF